MILDIIKLGNELLTKKSEDVKQINSEIKELVENMFDTMYIANGIGLAAVQVGILKRLFIMDVENKQYVMINPVIKSYSNKTKKYEEGCLSIPGITSNVIRPESIVVEYTDLENNRITLKANGLLATCIQHEIDHLNGILFIDRLEPEEKIKKINEFSNKRKQLIKNII